MATKKQPLKPLLRAQKRRSILPGYFDLGGRGLFVLVVAGASILGLLALFQTGRVVVTSYNLHQLQATEQKLRWEQEDLLYQIARAADPSSLEQWARANDMVILKPQEITAIPLVPGALAAKQWDTLSAQEP